MRGRWARGRRARGRQAIWAGLLCAAVALTGCEKMKSSLGMTPEVTPAAALEADKVALYAKVEGDLAQLHPFDQEMQQYVDYNPELKGKEPLTSYSARTDPFDSAMHQMKEAMAVKSDLGPLDAAAVRLETAMETLNPTVKAMKAYMQSNGEDVDHGKKAREFDGPYRAQMKETHEAAREFERLLTAKSNEMDSARLKTMKPDSLEYHALETNLAARQALVALGGLTLKTSPETKAAFLASLTPVTTANQGLATAVASYKGSDPTVHCKQYQTLTAKLVASGQPVADNPKAKAKGPHFGTIAEAFVSDYNDSLSEFSYCVRDVTEVSLGR
jgi:hypothetical protein